MSSIHDLSKDDDVNGVIVGTTYFVGAVFYDGRRQGRSLYAESDAQLKCQAEEFIAGKRAEMGELFSQIWPEARWELRVF